VNCARTDLSGGRSAMGVPTATEFNIFNSLEGGVLHDVCTERSTKIPK